MADIKKLEEQYEIQKEKVKYEQQILSHLETQLRIEHSKQDNILKKRYGCLAVEQLEEALKEWNKKHVTREKEIEDED